MNNSTQTSLLKTLQKEYIRRSLIQYFEEKGYDNFLVKPYPPTLIDITDRLPILSNMVEIKYFLEDINMDDNSIKVGWNIFILGNKRIFLGYTIHNNLNEIDNSAADSAKIHDGPIPLKSIVESMVELLGNSSKLADIYKQMDIDSSQNQNEIRPTYNSKAIPDFTRKV